MRADGKAHEREEDAMVRVELKYCEHCGGLWLRECGAGTVYCENCAAKVADLPIPKKKERGAALPVRPRAAVENYNESLEDRDMKAAGGVA